MVDPREQVPGVGAAHVADDLRGEIPSPSPRAARVGLEHRVATRQEEPREGSRPGIGERPHRTAVDVEDQRERPLAAWQRQEALDLQAVGRGPREHLSRSDARSHEVGAVVAGRDDRPGLVTGDDDQLGRPGRGVERDGDVVADRRRRQEEPAAGLARRPSLLRDPRGDVDLEDDGLQAADAGRDQDPVRPPGKEGDIDPVGVGPTNLAIVGVDQEQVAGDHQAVAADRFDHGHDVAGRRARYPSQLHVRLEERPVGPGGCIDQHDPRAIPGALARILGRDRHDAVVLAPGRLPDVEVGTTRRPELAGGHLQDHQPAAGAVGAVGGLHLGDPGRQVAQLGR